MNRLDLDTGAPPCADLRSKRWFFLERPARDVNELLDGSCAVWCVRTQQAVGPDGAVVQPEDCSPGRSCWRPAVDPT